MFKKLTDFLVFSNLYVALPITCLALSTNYIYKIEITQVQLYWFIYFAALFLYCFHRLFGLREIDGAISERHGWLKRNKTLFVVVLSLAFLGLAYTTFLLPIEIIVALVPAGLISFGYSLPVAFWKGKRLKLRDIPFVKIFLISLVVSYVTIILPLIMEGRLTTIPTLELGLVLAARSCFIFAITIPFDIRDMNFDSKYDLSTFPARYGVEGSKKIASTSLLVFGVISMIHFFLASSLTLYDAAALLLSGVAAVWVIEQSTPNKEEYFYSLIVEGTMILQFLLVVAASFVT